jgi:uncharacterized protein
MGDRRPPDQQRFLTDILQNRINRLVLGAWDALQLKDGWLVAGCLFQTVWNLQAGRAPEHGIKDYDIFYFDADDLSPAAELATQERVERVLGPLDVPIEVKNQARVHLWYEEHFGHPYSRLASAREGIDRFLIPSTCVGVRRTNSGHELHAPNGLAGLYAGLLTPNPLTPHLPLFREKAASYRSRWSWLQVREEP